MTLAIQQNSPYQTPISDTTSEITGEKKSRSFFPKGRINRKKFLKLQVPLVIMSVFIGLVILLTENTNLLEWLAVNINPLILMFVGILFIILYLFAIGYSILVTLPSLATHYFQKCLNHQQ